MTNHIEEACTIFKNSSAMQDRAARLELLDKEHALVSQCIGMKPPRELLKIYEERLMHIDNEIGFLQRVSHVLKAGYDPFTLGTNFVGFMPGYETPEPYRTRTDRPQEYKVMVFNAPMPPHVLARFMEAVNSNLFASFLVYSKDLTAFKTVKHTVPARMYLDPILVGTIDTPTKLYDHYGNVHAQHCFMIAQWDLSKELLALPAPGTIKAPQRYF